MTYSSDPIRDASSHYHAATLREDAADRQAAFILRTPAELQYVVESQDPDMYQYLVDIVASVRQCELKQPYAEATLLQACKGLRDMLTACAEWEAERYETDDDGRDE